MKTYQIETKTIIVIEENVYLKLDAIEAQGVYSTPEWPQPKVEELGNKVKVKKILNIPETKDKPKKKPGRKKGFTPKPKAVSKAFDDAEAIKEAVLEAYKENAGTIDELSAQYLVPTKTIEEWVAEKEDEDVPATNFENPRAKKYRCMNQHEFQSTSSFDEARCPECWKPPFVQI